MIRGAGWLNDVVRIKLYLVLRWRADRRAQIAAGAAVEHRNPMGGASFGRNKVSGIVDTKVPVVRA
jgi:hypothetical protein